MPNTITGFYTFASATKARATEVNLNFNNFRGALLPINSDTQTSSNGVHDIGSTEYSFKDIYISGDLYINSLSGSFFPIGTVFYSVLTSAPSSCLACDGSSVSRITYSDLFNVLTNSTNTSPAFGYETSTHFNLPDLRGKFVRGTDSGAGNDPDASSRTAQGTNGSTGDSIGSIQGYATAQGQTSIYLGTTGGHSHQFSIGNTLGSTYFSGANSGNEATTPTDTAGSHVHTITSSQNETRPLNLNLKAYIVY